MTDDVVIRANGLGKKYLLGHQKARGGYTALRDVLVQNAQNFGRSLKDIALGRPNIAGDVIEEFWALRDVAFEIKRGDVLGVVGRNGAGKSTLLKVLSRITEPSEGRVEIKGKVASLLEVGTGFHQELTGRENIFLNGSILGMSRAEILRKFDEIVDFAEIEKFLDTPVKRYSSGMYVRLAFAVAAHLEPEILIVDEVLAVGDAQFQQKCLGKMEDVGSQGRTVIFVSHNMAAVRRLCRTGLMLRAGQVVASGSATDVCDAYFSDQTLQEGAFARPTNENGFFIDRVEALDLATRSPTIPRTGDPVVFRIHFHSPHEVQGASVYFQVSTTGGALLFSTTTQPDDNIPLVLKPGFGFVDLCFPTLMFSAGRHVIGAGLAIPYAEWLYLEPHGTVMEFQPVELTEGRAPIVERNGVSLPHTWAVP
jgi:lipopolysaccharide transport system ATP-binding protein